MHSPLLMNLPPSVLALVTALSKRPVAPVRHACGFADEIRRRCVEGSEPAVRIAEEFDLDQRQVCGVVKILKYGRYSPERLACVVMRDWGMDDEDIAVIFKRSVKWARIVREQQDEIRQEEPMPAWMEYTDEGLQIDDPSPEEIARRAKEARGIGLVPSKCESYRAGIRSFSWRGDYATFFPVGVA